jgi:transposase
MSGWRRSNRTSTGSNHGPREFTKELKRDAVALVRATGRPIAQIAGELGIYDSTLGNWVRQDAIELVGQRCEGDLPGCSPAKRHRTAPEPARRQQHRAKGTGREVAGIPPTPAPGRRSS